MKTIILLLCFFSTIAFADYPKADNEYINDFADIIDDDVEKQIYQKLYDVEYYSGVEISVATIDSFRKYSTGAHTWEQFSTGLFNHWGVGNLPENNGVLFLVSKYDRKIRIEVGKGYSEHYNEIMKSIIDNNVSKLLTAGNYTAGIVSGMQEIINVTTVPVSFFEWYKWYIIWGIFILLSLIAALFIDQDKDTALFWIILATAGTMIIFLIKMLMGGNRSDGFGGGSSSGGGASGDF